MRCRETIETTSRRCEGLSQALQLWGLASAINCLTTYRASGMNNIMSVIVPSQSMPPGPFTYWPLPPPRIHGLAALCPQFMHIMQRCKLELNPCKLEFSDLVVQSCIFSLVMVIRSMSYRSALALKGSGSFTYWQLLCLHGMGMPFMLWPLGPLLIGKESYCCGNDPWRSKP